MQSQLQTIRNPHISRGGRCRISCVCVDNLSRVYFLIFQKCIMFPCPSAWDHYSCEWDTISTRTETRLAHFIRSFNYRCDVEHAWLLQEGMFVKADCFYLFSVEVELFQTHMFFFGPDSGLFLFLNFKLLYCNSLFVQTILAIPF